jgi:hypothetical protein
VNPLPGTMARPAMAQAGVEALRSHDLRATANTCPPTRHGGRLGTRCPLGPRLAGAGCRSGDLADDGLVLAERLVTGGPIMGEPAEDGPPRNGQAGDDEAGNPDAEGYGALRI